MQSWIRDAINTYALPFSCLMQVGRARGNYIFDIHRKLNIRRIVERPKNDDDTKCFSLQRVCREQYTLFLLRILVRRKKSEKSHRACQPVLREAQQIGCSRNDEFPSFSKFQISTASENNEDECESCGTDGARIARLQVTNHFLVRSTSNIHSLVAYLHPNSFSPGFSIIIIGFLSVPYYISFSLVHIRSSSSSILFLLLLPQTSCCCFPMSKKRKKNCSLAFSFLFPQNLLSIWRFWKCQM
jgi:hypothetical protein